MGLTSRKKRPIARQEMQTRDSRIFFVASEDCYAVKQYFDELKFRRVHVVTLPTVDSKSAPEHVVERLKQATKEYEIGEEDQLWYVLDTDHWVRSTHLGALTRAIQQARHIKATPAMSNPCFEVWLLLHIAEDLSALPENPCGDDVGSMLKKILPNGYNKTNIPTEQFTREQVELATERAAKLDPNPGEPWPKSPGSHFYRLMQAIFESER